MVPPDLTDAGIDLRLSPDRLEDTRQTVVSFVDERVAAAGVDGVVVGLSGGVDSSLTAALAVEALGPDPVKGLVMPSDVNDPHNMSDAERVAQLLGIECAVLDISPVLEALLDTYPEAWGDDRTVGNARARIRAVLNYLVANHEDRLVLGTGNRTELLTGYFTKHGDGAVDCNPIGTLYKQQVRQLARAVGVPDDIVEKPPTAGLRVGQTDEGDLGVAYDALDAILALHVEELDAADLSLRDARPTEMILALDTDDPLPAAATAELVGVDEETVAAVRHRYETSAHKRSMPPTPETPN